MSETQRLAAALLDLLEKAQIRPDEATLVIRLHGDEPYYARSRLSVVIRDTNRRMDFDLSKDAFGNHYDKFTIHGIRIKIEKA